MKNKQLKGLIGISKNKLRDSYFLRDITVCFLSDHRDGDLKISFRVLCNRIKKVLKLSYTPNRLIQDSICLWIGHENEVVTLLTNKEILYKLLEVEK